MIGYQEKINGLVLIAEDDSGSKASYECDVPAGYISIEFHFYNVHPVTDAAKFMWRSSVDAGGSYGVATQTSFVQTYHNEADSATNLSYNTSYDADLSTGDLYLSDGIGNDNDQGGSGQLVIYGSSSPTYVKHFMSHLQHSSAGDTCNISRTGGYINTTSDVDAVKFFFDSGNIDTGIIRMYGLT